LEADTMAAWFRKGLSRHQTAIAMVGPKPGDRIGIVSASDPDLAAEIALVTGLNGTTTVCDPDPDARARVETAAARAGALVEFEHIRDPSLPFADASQDVVVVMPTLAGAATLDVREPLRTLRDGGRIIIVDGVRSTGMFRSRAAHPRRPKDDVLRALEQAGTRARRQLADVDGVSYYEARK
jgi:SAM-dependent methyltransferase